MRLWRVDDRTVSWLLILAMLAPFVIASATHTRFDIKAAWLATPLLAAVAGWVIAHRRMDRPRLWMVLTVVVGAFWPVLFLLGFLIETFS